jgi:hypothetical protein
MNDHVELSLEHHRHTTLLVQFRRWRSLWIKDAARTIDRLLILEQP